MPIDYVGVASGCVTILLYLALLAVALVNVRKANPTAGYALAAAAGLHVLATCCTEYVPVAMSRMGNYELAQVWSVASRLLLLVDAVVFWGAVLFAAVTLARSIAATAAHGGSRG